MPYVLKHRETSQIWTSMLVNHYQLAYYGVKYWADEAEARAEAPALLEGANADEAGEWEVYLLPESAMKLANVKLKNDPAYRLYLDEQGRPFAVRD